MLCLIYLLFFVQLSQAKFYKTNVTDFSKCQIYYSRSGTLYKDFFEFPEQKQNGSILDFHFSVIASSDAHILLAPSAKVQKGDPVYEIVIGAGGNTFCDIRRLQKSGVKATIRIKGLLSGLDVHSFWVHIDEDGAIEVGKEGDELAFLSWNDADPLPLKVFSFSTWPGVEAKWFFDCPRDKENSSHSKELQRPLTPLEKLRKDLLYSYDPYVRPVKDHTSVTVVGLRLSTSIVTLDEYKSFLYYSGTVTLNWKDEKLRWNKSNYSNINVIHIFRREIWVPNLFLFNAVIDGNDILEDTMLTVNSKGYVNWTTTIKLTSWCDPRDLGNWPRDVHTCDLVLGFFKEITNLQLVFKPNDSTFSSPYSSRWAILQVETYANKGWKNASSRSLRDFDPPGLTLQMTMKRISSSYTVILFTPFIVIAVAILITFWISPFSQLKISLACFQLIVTCLVLIALSLMIPIHTQLIPNIVLLYSYSLVAITVCIFVEIVVVNLARIDHQTPLPRVLNKVILSVFLKMFLCLPEVEFTKQYGNLNVKKADTNPQSMWILLGVVMDRLMFFIYLGLMVYALCVTY